MDIFTLGWIMWGVYFVILEGVAIYRKARGDTLSEHVWLWFGVKKNSGPGWWGWIRRIALITFMLWLSLHFIFGL